MVLLWVLEAEGGESYSDDLDTGRWTSIYLGFASYMQVGHPTIFGTVVVWYTATMVREMFHP
jgi:hypothetical protein